MATWFGILQILGQQGQAGTYGCKRGQSIVLSRWLAACIRRTVLRSKLEASTGSRCSFALSAGKQAETHLGGWPAAGLAHKDPPCSRQKMRCTEPGNAAVSNDRWFRGKPPGRSVSKKSLHEEEWCLLQCSSRLCQTRASANGASSPADVWPCKCVASHVAKPAGTGHASHAATLKGLQGEPGGSSGHILHAARQCSPSQNSCS